MWKKKFAWTNNAKGWTLSARTWVEFNYFVLSCLGIQRGITKTGKHIHFKIELSNFGGWLIVERQQKSFG